MAKKLKDQESEGFTNVVTTVTEEAPAALNLNKKAIAVLQTGERQFEVVVIHFDGERRLANTKVETLIKCDSVSEAQTEFKIQSVKLGIFNG